MRSLNKMSLVVAALMASTAMVQAADIIPAPDDDYVPEILPHSSVGGWYIRGDIGYASLDVEDVTYLQGAFFTGSFEQHDLDSTWSIQGGIGYQATDYLRIDATLKYFGSSEFEGSSAQGAPCNGYPANTCDYNDDTELESTTLLMANAYVDLGTINNITPYVGAGIGGAHVSWGTLFNDQICDAAAPAACNGNSFVHVGEEQLRFAWAVHAGASYDVSCRTKIDAGYTFTHIEGGRMFGSGVPIGGGAVVGGNGYDDGIDIHEGRIGLRYALDDSGCHSTPPPVVYK